MVNIMNSSFDFNMVVNDIIPSYKMLVQVPQQFVDEMSLIQAINFVGL